MTESRPSPGTRPSVCPFVALAEDRDRRADNPDESNRCYAERAPRRRDLAYQAEYCYSADFARCSVFLAWAARNAAEPAIVGEGAGQPWAPGATDPTAEAMAEAQAALGQAVTDDAEHTVVPTPERGLFGLTEPVAPEGVRTSEQLDWISATAWAEAPWDERAELEAEELEVFEDDVDELEEAADEEEPPEEATTAPKVPAALPMRRRKPPQEPIRSRGSGEWLYSDPPAREPLVSRRYGVTPPVLLAVLAILIVSIVAFLIAAQLGGQGPSTAAASPSPEAAEQVRPVVLPATTAVPTEGPEPSATPRPRYYRARAGDSLTSIAARFGVRPGQLQCLNGILDRNLIVAGARYQIPPEGYSCTPGWRRATPPP